MAFPSIFGKRTTATEPYDTLGSRDVLPADSSTLNGKITEGANVALDRAAAIYNKNPKLIGALAAVAGAVVLSRLKRGRIA
jgi:hypothetical protein